MITGRLLADERRGPERLYYLRHRMARLLELAQPDIVALEGYAMGFGGNKRNPGRVFDIAELGGVFKTLFYEKGLTTILVSPSTMKMVVTGKGRTQKKNEIALALKRTFGITIQQNDEADAYGLLVVGELRSGCSPLPESVRQSLRTDSIRTCDIIPGRLKSIAT